MAPACDPVDLILFPAAAKRFVKRIKATASNQSCSVQARLI
jgi:hypothetical protein